MALMSQVGILPAMRDLNARSFAEAWAAMDSYMEKLMPPYKGALLLTTLAVSVLLLLQHRPLLASVCIASLLFSVAGLVLTIRGQLPLNAEIKRGNLSEARMIEIRERTSAGFRARTLLAALSFLSLCVGVVFWPLS